MPRRSVLNLLSFATICLFFSITVVTQSVLGMDIKLGLELDKLNYTSEETAVISLSGPPSKHVRLLIIDSFDRLQQDEIPITLGLDGEGVYSLNLETFVAGVYTAVVTRGQKQSYSLFSVGLQTGSGEIKIKTMKSSYKPRDSISVVGDTSPNVLITLVLRDPDGIESVRQETFSDKNGRMFDDELEIPLDGKFGRWTLAAVSGSNFDRHDIEVITVHDDGLTVTIGEGPCIPGVGKSISIKITGVSGTVTLAMFDDNGEQVEELELVASGLGEIHQPWIIPWNMKPGIYVIRVSDELNHAETTFSVPFNGIFPITSSPTAVDFGEIPIGKNILRSVIVANQAQETIRIAPLLIEGTDFDFFSLDTSTFSLDPGATKTISVGFTPNRTGDLNALLVAGRDCSRIAVPLSGVGVEPLAPGINIKFDQERYTWTDKVVITIEAPEWNRDPNTIEIIGDAKISPMVISTGVSELVNYRLVELGPDIGIFRGEVTLTGFLHDADGDTTTGDDDGFDTRPRTNGGAKSGPRNGVLETRLLDDFRVTLRVNSTQSITAAAPIQWQIGKVQWLDSVYNPFNGSGVVRVIDPDMDLSPDNLDSFDVDVWSDSDAGGIDLTVVETDVDSGVFEGRVVFTLFDESSGHRLRVAEGDTVTAEYEDNTLPPPSTIDDELDIRSTALIDPFVPHSPAATKPVPQPIRKYGSVRLDRLVYPVPFGDSGAFRNRPETTPHSRSLFPIHQTGMNRDDSLQEEEQLPRGDVTVHVEIRDSDFNISPTSVDSIALDATETRPGPVKISVLRGGEPVVLGYAGGSTTNKGRIDVGDNNPGSARQFGPIKETVPDSGIFSFDFEIAYTDGPAGAHCPETERFDGLTGDGSTDELSRFDSSSPGREDYCILTGDILVVEYIDPVDDIANDDSDTQSAFFQLRNGTLTSDNNVYLIGRDIVLTLTEPDLNLDNRVVETYDLDLIEWDSDAATITMGDADGHLDAFNPRPLHLIELVDQPGVFQTTVKMPEILENDRLERAEEVILEYTDWGPAGADYVGDEDEDINLTFYSSDFGAKVFLDKKVYSWTDKVGITVIAPDHNFDPNAIDSIGEMGFDPIKVSTRGFDLDQYKLVETGRDTGIFRGEVVLTGFLHDIDGDANTGDRFGLDTSPRTGGEGPDEGVLQADDDDGIAVSFEFSEDETVVASALIRWNAGNVEWDQAEYGSNDVGTVRVVDADMNLNPESIDSFGIDIWSETDEAGISILLSETDDTTGIFEGTVIFSSNQISSDNILRVAPGDTITVGYVDHTLPPPHTNADELLITDRTVIDGTAPRPPPSTTITFDQERYTWTDTVEMTITAPAHNGDPMRIETIGSLDSNRIRVATRGHQLDRYRFVETGADTGVFKGKVTLTGFLHNADGIGVTGDASGFDTIPETGPTREGGPNNGFLESWKSDSISVSFQVSTDESLIASVPIEWNEGNIQWLHPKYNPEGVGIIRVVDVDMNLHSSVVDFLPVGVWSESYPRRIDLVIFETERDSGIFEGQVFFTANEPSRKDHLQVADRDIVTVEYEDNTLPFPFTTADELDITATAVIDSKVPTTTPSPIVNNPITFDKNIYGWTDEVQISINSPEGNRDPETIDRIGAGGVGVLSIATSRGTLDEFSFVETAADSGIFSGKVTLTGFLFDVDGNKETGDAEGHDTEPRNDLSLALLKNTREDQIYVSYVIDRKRIASLASISWNVGNLSWLEEEYSENAVGIIEITDPDLNIFPQKKDGFQIIVWSDSDPAGIVLEVEESDVTSGVFNGEVQFTRTRISGAGNLYVTPGDTITAHYLDHTLPTPHAVGDHLVVSGTTTVTDSGVTLPAPDITIGLDRASYTWTDQVFITVNSPRHNSNPDKHDEIGSAENSHLRIATRGHQLDFYRLFETDTDSGIFTGEVILTGFPHDADGNPFGRGLAGSDTDPMTTPHPRQGPKDGFIESSREDFITVSFKASGQNPVVQTAPIFWQVGKIEWLNEDVFSNDFSAFIRVTDRDMNLDPKQRDSFQITIRSELNGGTSRRELLETTADSGVFEDEVFLRTSGRAFRSPIRVSPGDRLSAAYQDRTLPRPHDINDVLVIEDTIAILPPWQTASVTLDREVYPIPFGTSNNFDAVGSNPEGHSLFPVHSAAITEIIDTTGEQLPQGNLIVHVKIHDSDRNRLPTAIEEIAQTIEGEDVAPVKVSVIRDDFTVALGYAGGPSTNKGRIDVNDNDPLHARHFGPIRETAMNSGVFAFDLPITFTDGPASALCPATIHFDSLDDGDGNGEENRFDEPSGDGQNYCILRGDTLLIEYTDPLDNVGQPVTVTTSAIFDLRSGVLSTDKNAYMPHSDVLLTLTDPDLNLDNEAVETHNLDLIEWNSEAATITLGKIGGEISEFMPRPTHFVELVTDPGTFQATFRMPEILQGNTIQRGEEVRLEYMDWGPSTNAHLVGDTFRSATIGISASNVTATVEFDKRNYSWTDKVHIRIFAPTLNVDPDGIDTIGDSGGNSLIISTRNTQLENYPLIETEADSGIFTGKVELTGFLFDADGDPDTGDGDGFDTTPRTDLIEGLIESEHDDEIRIILNVSEEERVKASAPIHWTLGKLTWLQQPIDYQESGFIGLVDPDMNLDSDLIDRVGIQVRSESDLTGISLTLTETTSNSGVFGAKVFFTTTGRSTGNRLLAAVHDRLTAEYVDHTLPSPFRLGDQLRITTDAVFQAFLFFGGASASNPRLIDSFGNALGYAMVDQSVQIMTDLRNTLDRENFFTYIVQIENEDNIVVDLSWVTGSLTRRQTFSPQITWTPELPGVYTATIFVWEFIDNPLPLSDPQFLRIIVNSEGDKPVMSAGTAAHHGARGKPSGEFVTATNPIQTRQPLVITTDKTTYKSGEMIAVSGRLFGDFYAKRPFTLQIFNPLGHVIRADQFFAQEDGSFSQNYVAGGPLWSIGGEYIVQVAYGGGTIARSVVEFRDAGDREMLTIDPQTIDFGSVEIDEIATQSIILSNTSATDLRIHSVSVNGQGTENFDIDTTPFPLAAGESRTLNVRFVPQRTGARAVILTFSTDVFDISMELRGFGKIPDREITVTTDQEQYCRGEVITVSGAVVGPFNIRSPVLLTITNPLERDLIQNDRIPLETDGTFSRTYTADGPLWDRRGSYRISTTHDGLFEQLDVEFEQEDSCPNKIFYVNDDAEGLDDGSSWDNAFRDLQSALSVLTWSGDEIWVASGTYTPDIGGGNIPGDRNATFRLKSGVAVYGGFNGTESKREQRNWDANETILSGDLRGDDGDSPDFENYEDNSLHVVTGVFTVSTTVLDGFTVSGGNANGSFSGSGSRGGGMLNQGGNAKVKNCTFFRNYAFRFGGGAYSNFIGIEFSNCSFIENESNRGGGLYHAGGHRVKPILENCLFRRNNARIRRSFSESFGGGLAVSGAMEVRNSFFLDNTAESGGGMSESDFGSSLIINSVFANNSAEESGGGLFTKNSSPLISNCTFVNNTSLSDGGAIGNYRSDTVIQNSIIWNDRTGVERLEIFNRDRYGTTKISFSILKGAFDGDGVWDESLGINAGNNIDMNPLFIDPDGPDDVAGTNDDNFRLWPGSPAIDAGNNDVDVDPNTDEIRRLPNMDLARNSRFVDDPDTPDTGVGAPPIVDMGAYEFDPLPDVIAHWKLDEVTWNGSADDVIDSSELENHGSSRNGVQTIAQGKLNRAGKFDGVDDGIDLGQIESGDPLQLTGGGTLAGWFNQEPGGNRWQRIIDKSTNHSGANGYALIADPLDRSIWLSVNKANYKSSADLYAFNEWTHVAAVITASAFTIYVNGVEVDGGFQTGEVRLPPGESAPMLIGNWNHGPGRAFNGNLDDLRIYHRVLNASEIAQIPIAASADNALVAYYDFSEGTGCATVDVATGTLGKQGRLEPNCMMGSSDGPAWSIGVVNAGLTFDGEDDYIELGNVEAGHPLQLSGGGTVTAWFRPQAGNRWQRIVDKSTNHSGTNGYALIADPLDRSIWLSVNQANYKSAAGVYEFSEWAHVAAVITESAFTIYVDGDEVSGSFVAGTARLPPNIATGMRIGTWNHSSGRVFHGALDELRIYNRALGVGEISQISRRAVSRSSSIVGSFGSKPIEHARKAAASTPTHFSVLSHTVYEDAEDGMIDGWQAYGDGAVINLGDEIGNRIISTTGEFPADSFRLGLSDDGNWNNTEEFTASFVILMEDDAAVYFRVDTTDGEKYLCYRPGFEEIEIDDSVICFGLGIEPDGNWHEVIRNLAEDLEYAIPGTKLISIKDFYIFGSAGLDNLILYKHIAE